VRGVVLGSLLHTLHHQLPIVSNAVCSETVDGITEDMLCAGEAEGGKDACQVSLRNAVAVSRKSSRETVAAP
jgi:hypothetical protein